MLMNNWTTIDFECNEFEYEFEYEYREDIKIF